MLESPPRSGGPPRGGPDRALLGRAKDLGPKLVDIRRTVHRLPELGFEEHATQRLVGEQVKELVPGAEVEPVGGTGVMVRLRSTEGPGRPLVLLRACLDALPIEEQTGAEYASTIAGVSHACGHDGQVAVLLGALALLGGTDPEFGVAGLFQPAEELDTGARAVLDAGMLEDLRPSVMLGFHGHPLLPAGTASVAGGPVMASIATIRCRVAGRGGHGAEPHLTTDTVTAAAALILDWQVALGRRIDPRQPAVLSVGRIEAGSMPNVIPEAAELEATVRTLDPTTEERVEDLLRTVARAVELRSGSTIDLAIDRVVPVVLNDLELARLGSEAVTDLLGADALGTVAPSLGGDDFAWYLREVPGLYVFVGEGQPDRTPYGWHDPAYDLDERSLPFGAAALTAIASGIAKGARL